MVKEKPQKLKLLGIGNKDAFNFFVVAKEKHFFDTFNSVIAKAFPKLNMSIYKFGYLSDKHGEPTIKVNVPKSIDKHESMDFGNFRIDVFLGTKKVFITLYTKSENVRKEFVKALNTVLN
ncbi:MAG: hypothetical protein ABR981_05040 [Candidatus Micrarchaeaceae archaeon]|jgi:hypothetical protein